MDNVSIPLESRPRAGREVRDRLRDALEDRLAQPQLHDLITVVTELVNNSVEHGPGKPILVTVSVGDDGGVRGEVEDQGEGEVAIREMIHGAGGGLGLHIVQALTRRWAVYEGSTHVWFEMDASA